MEGRGKFRGEGMWGRLLLHFIRTLIRRLITRILCPYTLRLNRSLQLDRENRDAARGCWARFGLVYFTSLYSSWLQFRTVHFPLAAGYRCRLFGLLKSEKVFASFAVRHTSVISTSSVLSLFSCCRRGCCLGGGGAARTCKNITFKCMLYCMLLLLSECLNSNYGKNNEEQKAACGFRNSLLNSSPFDTFTTPVWPTLWDQVGRIHY